jgi:hypothetical protein
MKSSLIRAQAPTVYDIQFNMMAMKVILPVLYFFNKIKLSITMTKRLSSVKEGLQSYCNKVYLRSSFNTMWILKYSYDLLGSEFVFFRASLK